MKRYAILSLLILSALIIFSGCGKDTRTHFEDLPQQQQNQIKTEVKDAVFSGYLERTSVMLAQPSLSDDQKERIINSNVKLLQSNVKNYLKTHYPDINFDSWIEKMK